MSTTARQITLTVSCLDDASWADVSSHVAGLAKQLLAMGLTDLQLTANLDVFESADAVPDRPIVFTDLLDEIESPIAVGDPIRFTVHSPAGPSRVVRGRFHKAYVRTGPSRVVRGRFHKAYVRTGDMGRENHRLVVESPGNALYTAIVQADTVIEREAL